MNEQAAIMSVDQAREAINRWSNSGFFRRKQLGDQILIEDVSGVFSYTMQLHSQYEQRIVNRDSEPYRGGYIDNNGIPPNPWELPIAAPNDFADRTERIRLPHTDQIERCSRCRGSGRDDCTWCHGSGSQTCSQCGGSGSITETETITDTDSQGNTQTRTETATVSCSCSGGRVACSSCGGDGSSVCSYCDGRGEMITFELLTVEFRARKNEDVLDTTDVPDKLLGRAVGEAAINIRSENLDSAPSVTPEVDARIPLLFQQANGHIDQNTRLLYQQLWVQRLGVTEIHYRFGSASPKRLWIFGSDQSVYAPGAPKAWGRILLVTVGIMLALAGVAYALAYSGIKIM